MPEPPSLASILAGMRWLDEPHARSILVATCDALAHHHRAFRAHGAFAERLDDIVIDGAIVLLPPPSFDADAVRPSSIDSLRCCAPELLTGPYVASPASDVWALGLLAFRLLTGAHFFDTTSIDVLHRAILIDPIGLPSRVADRRALPTTPPWLDRWFACTVVRSTAARFPNAAVARRALVAEPVDE